MRTMCKHCRFVVLTQHIRVRERLGTIRGHNSGKSLPLFMLCMYSFVSFEDFVVQSSQMLKFCNLRFVGQRLFTVCWNP